MFERAAVFSALLILIALTLVSLSYYKHLESDRQIEIVRESDN